MPSTNEQINPADAAPIEAVEKTDNMPEGIEAPRGPVSIMEEVRKSIDNYNKKSQEDVSGFVDHGLEEVGDDELGEVVKNEIRAIGENTNRQIEGARDSAVESIEEVAEKLVKAIMGEDAFEYDNDQDRIAHAHQQMVTAKKKFGKDSPEAISAYDNWKGLYDEENVQKSKKQESDNKINTNDEHPVRKSIATNMGIEEGRKKFEAMKKLIDDAKSRKNAEKIDRRNGFVESDAGVNVNEYQEEIGEGFSASTEELANMRAPLPEQLENSSMKKKEMGSDSSRYLANFEKIKFKNPDLSDEEIDSKIRYAEISTLRSSEEVGVDVERLIGSLGDKEMPGFEINDILADMEAKTGIPIDDLAAIYHNQKVDLENQSEQLVQQKKGKWKSIGKASLKALGYGALGAGAVVATGGAGLLAGLSAGGIASIKILDRLRIGRQEKEKAQKELEELQYKLKNDESIKNDFRNRIYAEMATRVQAEIDGRAEEVRYIDQEIELAEKEYIESLNAESTVAGSTPEEMKNWLNGLKKRKLDLSQSILGEYLNNNEEYRDVDIENVVRQANGLSEIDSNNQLMEMEEVAKNSNWFKRLGNRATKLLGINTQRDRRESITEKTAKASVFTLAGLAAKEIPVIRNILMGYAGSKGADALAKWRTGETKKGYEVLRQVKYGEIAGKSQEEIGESLEMARAQVLDEDFKLNNPSEYALIKNELDRIEQENLRERSREAMDYTAERTEALMEKMVEKAGSEQKQRRYRAAAKIGGAVLGALAPEAFEAAKDYFHETNPDVNIGQSTVFKKWAKELGAEDEFSEKELEEMRVYGGREDKAFEMFEKKVKLRKLMSFSKEYAEQGEMENWVDDDGLEHVKAVNQGVTYEYTVNSEGKLVDEHLSGRVQGVRWDSREKDWTMEESSVSQDRPVVDAQARESKLDQNHSELPSEGDKSPSDFKTSEQIIAALSGNDAEDTFPSSENPPAEVGAEVNQSETKKIVEEVDEVKKREINMTAKNHEAPMDAIENEVQVEPGVKFASEHGILTKTGAEVKFENGQIHVKYEVGKDGDYAYLDQALRRLVVDNYKISGDKFTAVDAARAENVLANLRGLIEGKNLAGMRADDLKEMIKFDEESGELKIDDYGKFEEKVSALFERANTNINENSDAMAEVNNTSNSNWQEMLDQKTGTEGNVEVEEFNDNDKVFEAEERVRNEIEARKSSIKSRMEELGGALGGPAAAELADNTTENVINSDPLINIVEKDGVKIYEVYDPKQSVGRDVDELEKTGSARGYYRDFKSDVAFKPEMFIDTETDEEYISDHTGRAIPKEEWNRYYLDHPRHVHLAISRALFEVNAVPETIDSEKFEVLDKLPGIRNRELIELPDGRVGIRDTENNHLFIQTEKKGVFVAYENGKATEFFGKKDLGDFSRAAEEQLNKLGITEQSDKGNASGFLPEDDNDSGFLPE